MISHTTPYINHDHTLKPVIMITSPCRVITATPHTCRNLHIVHGALSTGIKKSTWFLEKLLRSIIYLFEDAPARREDFITITKTTTFPKPFCATRWLDDMPVAQRAIDIWSSITKYVVETMKKLKSKIPTCESFKVVSECVNNAFILAKLEFLVWNSSHS